MLLLSLLACSSDPVDSAEAAPTPPLSDALLDQIDPHNIKAHVDFLADDALGGRIPGSVGSLTAQDYIVQEMAAIGLQPLGLDQSYVYTYENSPSSSSWIVDGAGAVVPHQTSEGVDLITGQATERLYTDDVAHLKALIKEPIIV